MNVLKFRTLVVCQKGRDKQGRLNKQSDQSLPCLLFWQTFCEIPALVTNVWFENKLFDTLMVFLKYFFEKSRFWKLISRQQKTCRQGVKNYFCPFITQGSHRLEKYLNLDGFLEKALKIKSALKNTGKSLKSLEKSLNSTIFCTT